jgi:hypothetical protein
MCTIAGAQTNKFASTNDPSELKNFQTLIQEHPHALAELKKNPSALGTRQFAKEYPRVGRYLEQHPGIVSQVKANPKFFDGLAATSGGGQHGGGKHRWF